MREAIRGSRQDYTEAPIGEAVVLLAVPMVLEMLMESVFAVADIFFVGRLGAEAVATVGITESLMTVIYAVAMGLSIGATATVARRMGEKNPDRAARAAVQSIALGVIVAVLIGTVGVVFAPQLLRAMGASPVVLETGSTFGRVMLGMSGTVLLLFLGNAVFRAAGDAAIATASWIGLIRILAGFGSAAVAGNTIGIRIIMFALLPSFGVSNAAATLVGQNLGAGKPARAEAAVWRAGFYNTVCLVAVGLIFLAFAPQLIGLFSSDLEVVPYGVRCLRIVAAGFLFYGYGMVLTQAFNGAGDTRTPTWIHFGCLWMFELPLAWALAYPLDFGPTGVFIAVSVAFSVLALVSASIFRMGRWKTRTV